jgi:hypothetical protein
VIPVRRIDAASLRKVRVRTAVGTARTSPATDTKRGIGRC